MIVVAAVIRKKGKILLAERRREDSESFVSGWEFPGGKVESGETLEQALLREIYEELGIQIRILRQLDSVDIPEKPGFELTAFAAELVPGCLKLKAHRQICWVKPEHLPEFDLLPADRELLKKLLEKSSFYQPWS